MLKDFSLGKYFSAESLIHDLDPRFKLITTFSMMIMLFLIKSPSLFLIFNIFIFIIIYLSKIPLLYVLKGIRPIAFFLLITISINMFFTPGEVIFSAFSFIEITREGLEYAFIMTYRLILLITSSSIMTYTTRPTDLTFAMEYMLKPLKIFKLPVNDLAMMMSLSIRFIPTLLDETNKIIKAQTARGARFDSKNLFKKAKSYLPILIPIFVSALRRATDLANAMESRSYRGSDFRTRMKEIRFSRLDLIGLLVLLSFYVLLLFLEFVVKI